MPLYESLCHRCNKVHTYWAKADDRLNTPECCGEKTEKVILSAPMGIVDIPAYVSPVSGRLINSRTQRNDDLARAGCRPWEGMEQETKEAARQKAYEEQKADKVIDKALGDTLAALTA